MRIKIYICINLFVWIFLISSLRAGNIDLRHFSHELKYAPGSGVSVAFQPNDTFNIQNEFILELSDVNNDWNRSVVIKSVSEFYVPVINAVLPQDLLPGEYQMRVRATYPADTLYTNSFSVVGDRVNSSVRLLSDLPNNTNFFNCLSCDSYHNIFGSQNQQEGASTSSLNVAQRTMTICGFEANAQYIIQLSDVLRNQKMPLEQTNGVFQIPVNLPIGTYVLTVEKTYLTVSDVYSVVFIFHGNGTSLGNSSSEEICVGSSVVFNVDTSESGIGRNYPGSKYVINFGDGTPKLELTQAQLMADSKIEHIYEIPSCTETGSYFTVQSNLYSKGIQNECDSYSKNGSGVTKRVNSSQPPKAVFIAPETVCYGSATTILNSTIPGFYGSAGCRDESNFFWYYKRPGDKNFTYVSNKSWVDAGNNLVLPASFLSREGCWEFKLEAQNKDLCQSLSEFVDTVMVERKTTALFTTSATTICPNETVIFVNTSPVLENSCSQPSFYWSVWAENSENSNGFVFDNGTTNVSKDIALNFLSPGDYNVQLNVRNSCGDNFSEITTVKVSGTPEVTFPEAAYTVCKSTDNSTVVDFSQEGYKPAYSVTPYEINAYEWIISGEEVTPGDYEFIQNTNAQSVYPVIRFNTLKSFTIQVNVAGNCGFSSSDDIVLLFHKQGEITGNLTSQNICSGESIQAVTPETNNPNVIFRWTIARPQTLETNASDGSGMLIPFAVFTNNTDSVLEAVYTVVPFDGYCEGVAQTFSVKVNPSFSMVQPADLIACANDSIAAIIFAGSLPKGINYKWTNSEPSIGLPASGMGNLPAFKALNNTNKALTATISIEPVLNINNTECSGESTSFNITVLPEIVVSQINDIEVFNSQQISKITFASNVEDGNVRYFWSNSNPKIGLTANGKDEISAFSAANYSDTVAVSKITVYAVCELNGVECQGDMMEFDIRVKPTSYANLSGDASVCMGAEMPVVTFKGLNGTSPYTFTYRVNNGEVLSVNTVNTDSVNFFVPTNAPGRFVYKLLSATDSKNEFVNYKQDSVIVVVADNPLIKVQPVAQQTICIGGDAQTLRLEFEGGAGNTQVRWYRNSINNNANGTFISSNAAGDFKPEPFAQPGNYYFYAIVVSDQSSCGMAVSEVSEVVVLPDPIILSQNLPLQSVCTFATADTLSIEADGHGYELKYQWYRNITPEFLGAEIIENARDNFFIPTTSEASVFYYFCEITMPFGGCSVFSDFAKTVVYRQPEISRQPVSQIVCLSEGKVNLSVSYEYGSSEAKYQWFENTENNNSGGILIPGATDSLLTVNVTETTVRYYYCEIGFDTKDCAFLSSEVATVNVLQYPVILNYTVEAASGISFNISPENSQSQIVPKGTQYSWAMPQIADAGSVSGASPSNEMSDIFSQTLVNNTNHPVQLRYVLSPVANGCEGAVFEVIVNLQPAISVLADVKSVSCNGANDGALSVQIIGGIPFKSGNAYRIEWTADNGFVSSLAQISGLAPGEYHLQIIDSVGSVFDANYYVNEPQMLVITADSVSNVLCAGASNGFISINVEGGNGGYKYEWTKNGQFLSNDSILKNISSGQYSVYVTDKRGCRSETLTFNITEPDEIQVNLISASHNSCFGDNQGTIEVDVKGGKPAYKYNWSGPNAYISSDKNITQLYAGEYTLVVTDENACAAVLNYTITQNEKLVVNAQTKPESCYGRNDGEIELVVTGGVPPYSVVWSNLAEGYKLNNLSPGMYSATIVDAVGCVADVQIEIDSDSTFNIKPEIKNVTCFGANDGRIKLNLSTESKNVKLKWSDGSKAGTERNNLAPGLYSVEIDNGSACVITESFAITEPELLTVSGTVTHAFSCNSAKGGAVELQVTGGTAPYTYLWSNGTTEQKAQNLNAGTYYVTVRDNNGCSTTEEFKVIRPLPLKLNVESSVIFDCKSSTVKQVNKALVSGGIPPYQLSWSAGEVSGLNADTMISDKNMTVFVTVVDAAGCSKTEVFNNEVQNVGIQMSVVDCDHMIYAFDVAFPESFLNNATYLWSFGDGNISESKSTVHAFRNAGNYDVRLSVKNGDCSTEFAVSFAVDSLPLLTLNRQPVLCPNDSVEISVSGAKNYVWEDGSTGSRRMIRKEGNYSVTGITATGCSSVLNFTARYYNPVNYRIFADREVVTPEQSTVNFWTNETDSAEYQWEFGQNLPMRAGSSVSYSFDIKYPTPIDVKLNVQSAFGCIETAAKRIWALTSELPNTFTPNGDGVNDIFLEGVELEVYNSNGVLLYKGKDGWDGKFNGREVAIDTYYYVVMFFTPDGMVSKPGYITLIR